MAKTVFGMPGVEKKPTGAKSPQDSSKAEPSGNSETPDKEPAPTNAAPGHPNMVKPVAAKGAAASPFRKTDVDDKAQTVLGFPAVKPGGTPMARPSDAPAGPSATAALPAVGPGNTPPLGLASQAPAARDVHPSALSGVGVAGHGTDEMAFKETVLGMSAVSREQAERHVAEKAAETISETGAVHMPVAFEETVQAGGDSPITAETPVVADSSVATAPGGEEREGDTRPKGVSKTLIIIILVAVGITLAALLINRFIVGRTLSSAPTPSVPTRLLQPIQPPQQPLVPTVQPVVPPPAPVAPTPGVAPTIPGTVSGAPQPTPPAPQ